MSPSSIALRSPRNPMRIDGLFSALKREGQEGQDTSKSGQLYVAEINSRIQEPVDLSRFDIPLQVFVKRISETDTESPGATNNVYNSCLSKFEELKIARMACHEGKTAELELR
ncbi:hypothetical protein B0O80DRAFT_492893 [Mortierella sp. GBAus27b]|nr:hypothetical protein B0O80DRAFT_492893 [Mortierella sp. GBAus27b]